MVTLVKLPMGAGRPPHRVTPGKGDVGELPAMATLCSRADRLCGLKGTLRHAAVGRLQYQMQQEAQANKKTS